MRGRDGESKSTINTNINHIRARFFLLLVFLLVSCPFLFVSICCREPTCWRGTGNLLNHLVLTSWNVKIMVLIFSLTKTCGLKYITIKQAVFMFSLSYARLQYCLFCILLSPQYNGVSTSSTIWTAYNPLTCFLWDV